MGAFSGAVLQRTTQLIACKVGMQGSAYLPHLPLEYVRIFPDQLFEQVGVLMVNHDPVLKELNTETILHTQRV